MFKQTGIVNVTSVQEVVDCAVAFHYLPLPKGRRVAVIGGQGGTGVGTADNCYALWDWNCRALPKARPRA